MQYLRRTVTLVLAALVIAAVVTASPAQEADADRARELLENGVEQYKNFQYRDAKATLLQAAEHREALGQAQVAQLDEYLGQVNTAITAQAGARRAFESAQTALKAGDLEAAREGFSVAAASEHLPPDVRSDANEQLALVLERIRARKAAEEPAPADDDLPIIEVVAEETNLDAEPGSVVSEDGAETTDEQTERLMAQTAARRARVQQLVSQGRTSMDEGQYAQAVELFERALVLDPDNARATAALEDARKLTATGGESELITRIQRERRIRKQMADSEYAESVRRAYETLATADEASEFSAAAEAARSAQNVLESNKGLYPAAEYREKISEVRDLQRNIERQREAWEKEQVRRQQQEIAEQEAIRRQKETEQRQRKIETLMSRAKTMREQNEFQKAVDLLEQVRNLDPNNNQVLEMIETLTQFVILQREEELRETLIYQEQKLNLEIREAEIPWYQYLRYPPNWKEITVLRQPFGAEQSAESEADRRVREKLRSQIITPKFEEIEFQDVVQFLRDSTGVNIYVNWQALQVAGIDKSSPVTVNLRNVSAATTLDKVLESVGGVTPLSYVIQDGVVTVSTQEALSRQTVTRVYDIRDLIIRVPNFEGPRIELSAAGNGGGDDDTTGGGFGGDDGGLFGDGDDEDEEDEANIPTKAEIIDGLVETIKETIDPLSWRPAGETGSIREMHGQLIVTQTQGNHERLLDLLSQIREARALQISIEARFISVNSGFLNSIGVDLDFFFNLGSALGSGDDRPIADPWTGTSSDVNRTGQGTMSDSFTPIGVSQGSFPFSNMVGTSTAVPNSIGGIVSSPATSIGGTFLNDVQVNFLIEATQAHQSTRALTAPRLTLYNGQRAYITVATQQAYVADLQPSISENQVAFDPVLAYVPTGTVLDIEATISADRRYVTLTVRPQVAVLNGFTRYFTNVTESDDEGNPISGEGFIQLPNVTIQDLQTTVSVPDGGTLLLGGQKLTGEVNREMGVPVLSKVPVVNRFVTNKGRVRDEQTLLILIKPKIIIQREEEERQVP